MRNAAFNGGFLLLTALLGITAACASSGSAGNPAPTSLGINGTSPANVASGRAAVSVVSSLLLGEGGRPNAIVANPKNGTVYVLEQWPSNSLAVIEVGGKVGKLGPWDTTQPRSLALNPDTDTLYMGTSNSLEVIDTRENKLIKSIPVQGMVVGLAVDRASGRVFASVQRVIGGWLMVVDGRSNEPVGSVGLGWKKPQGVAANSASGKVYVATQFPTNGVLVLDGTSLSIEKTVGGISGPVSLAVNEETNKIYVTRKSAHELVVIDGVNDVIFSNVDLSPRQVGVAVDTGENMVYVAYEGKEPGVAVVDGSNDTLVEAVALQSAPSSLSLTSRSGLIYAASSSQEQVRLYTLGPKGLTPPLLNLAPVFQAIGNQAAKVGETLRFAVNALDANGDPLTYSAANLPPGSKFDPDSKTFSWTPFAPGTFKGVRFSVSDGMYEDSTEMEVTVSFHEVLRPVAAGGDDGFSGDSLFRTDTTWFQAGNPAGTLDSWLRFTGIAIPQGAVILEARLEVLQQKWSPGTRLRIYAEKAANPAAPASSSDYQGKARTTASARWTSGGGDGTWQRTPDLAAIIQELVNTFDYSTGGAVQIFLEDDGSSRGAEMTAATLEGGHPPRLFIKFQKKGLPLPAVIPNRPPVLAVIGDQTSRVGSPLTFTVRALDPDGDPLTYSASRLPPGATFDPGTRTFFWRPAAEGVFSGIRFSVSDGKLSDSEEMNIAARLPEVTRPIASPGDDGFSAGDAFRSDTSWFAAGNAAMPAGAWLRFTGIAIPQGAVILEARLEVLQQKWSPGTRLRIYAEKAANPAAPGSAAGYQTKARTKTSARWSSGNGDAAWRNSPDFSWVIQELVDAYDYSNGGTMQLFLDDDHSPNGAEMVGASFESGQPPRLFIKYLPRELPMPSRPGNRAPVLEPVSDKTVQAGEQLTFTVNAFDPDADPLTYWATGPVQGATFDPKTRTFAWKPAVPGTHKPIIFNVSDGTVTDSEEITITVAYPELVVAVASRRDDGFASDSAFRTDATWFQAGNATSPAGAWFRFASIAIPRGAVILEARLEVLQQKWTPGTRLRIYAERIRDPEVPASTPDYLQRLRTRSVARWTSGGGDGTWQRTPDLAAIIQELVNTFDYSTGGAVQIFLEDDGSSRGAELAGATFDGGQPARLYVRYQRQ